METRIGLSDLIGFFVFLLYFYRPVSGHGRLINPPSRASMWRFGFNMPISDYDDNQGYCGGREQLWNRYGGKCGVCGDPVEPTPRAHERRGRYYIGTPVKTYRSGDIITAEVEVTANHRGWFEFRLCPYDYPSPEDVEHDSAGRFVEVTQTCLDKHLLHLVDEKGTRFILPKPWKVGIIRVRLKLPPGISCDNCLFQWKYNTGNFWGTDPDGKSCVGCGLQEQFFACSDIVIKRGDSGQLPQQPVYSPTLPPPVNHIFTFPPTVQKRLPSFFIFYPGTNSQSLPSWIPRNTIPQIPPTSTSTPPHTTSAPTTSYDKDWWRRFRGHATIGDMEESKLDNSVLYNLLPAGDQRKSNAAASNIEAISQHLPAWLGHFSTFQRKNKKNKLDKRKSLPAQPTADAHDYHQERESILMTLLVNVITDAAAARNTNEVDYLKNMLTAMNDQTAESTNIDLEHFLLSPTSPSLKGQGVANETRRPRIRHTNAYLEKLCKPVGPWRNNRTMSEWCLLNCGVGNCSEIHCNKACRLMAET